MRVSVIITVYNLENFVGAAIESVLQQTRQPDEIIVVDDGSKDGSVNAVKRYGSKVRLLEMGVNQGVLPAFIAAMKAAGGDVLAFLDGDDTWMPDKLEKAMKEFEADEDVMMVTHLHRWMDKNGDENNKVDATHLNLRQVTATGGGDVWALDRLLKNSMLSYKGVWLGSAFCIRRKYLDLTAYEAWVTGFPGKNLSHQDQPLGAYLVYANPGKRIAFINEYLFRYRVYETNSSGASVNVVSALRTIERSIATVSRTKNIVERNPAWKEELFHQQMRLKELVFYKNLYTKKRLSALRSFLGLFLRFWHGKEKVKEAKRLLLCLVLGPEHFLKLKTRKTFKS